jgi:hypothetical protein
VRLIRLCRRRFADPHSGALATAYVDQSPGCE